MHSTAAAPRSAMEAPWIARRYEIINEVGHGTSGVVERAVDHVSGRIVTLKRVSFDASAEAHAALGREFELLASLRHPNIVTALDFGRDPAAGAFLVVDLQESALPLVQALLRQPVSVQIDLLAQCLRALLYLHGRGIVHRDIQSANVLVVDGRVKLLDFGLACTTAQALDERGSIVGTPAYMAPEVMRGEACSASSDLFSLGLVIYEAVIGHYPLPADAVGLYHAVSTTMLPRDTDGIDARLLPVLRGLLAIEPGHRFDEARTALDVLHRDSREVFVETAMTRESVLQSARFVGRLSELGQFKHALSEAIAGRGAILLLGGESGAGKSRLVNELQTMALLMGLRVARGQAMDKDTGMFRLWDGVNRHLLLLADEPASASGPTLVASEGGGAAAQVTGAAGEAPSYVVMERLFAAQRHPLFVIFEDLHWAGTESLKLLQWLEHSVRTLPILIVGTFRPHENVDPASFVTEATQIRLPLLTGEDVSELAASILGAEIGQRTHRFLMDEAGGNPLFVVETIRVLAEDAGALEAIAAPSARTGGFTAAQKAILSKRLNQLASDDVQLLQYAAVLGRDIEAALLQSFAAGTNIEAWAQRCASEAVLEFQDDRYRFSHEKLREYIAGEIPPQRRPALHRAVAEAIESLSSTPRERAAALADHWRVAGDRDREMSWALVAAEQNLTGGAYQEAEREFRRVRSLVAGGAAQPDGALSAQVRIEMGLSEACYKLGILGECCAHSENALRLLGRGVPSRELGFIGAALTGLIALLAARFLPRSPRPHQAECARLLLRLTDTYFYALRQYPVVWATLAAVTEARALHGSQEQAQAYALLALLANALPSKRPAHACSIRALRNARASGDDAHVAWVQSRTAVYRLSNCEWDKARREICHAEQTAARCGNLRLRLETKAELGMLEILSSRYTAGAAVWADIREQAQRSGDQQIKLWGYQGESFCLMRLGDYVRARELCEVTLGALPDRYLKAETLWAYAYLAAIDLRLADFGGAHGWCEKAVEELHSTPQIAYWQQPSLNVLMETLVYLDRSGRDSGRNSREMRAATLASLQKFAQQQSHGRPAARLWKGVAAANAGHNARARELLSQSLALAEASAMPYDIAWAHWELARLDPAEQTSIKKACTMFEALGCPYETQMARSMAGASAAA